MRGSLIAGFLAGSQGSLAAWYFFNQGILLHIKSEQGKEGGGGCRQHPRTGGGMHCKALAGG